MADEMAGEGPLQNILGQLGGRITPISNSLGISSGGIKILTAIAIAYGLNKAFRRRKISSLALSHQWNWKQEIVLVTGGCSGIGEGVVRKLSGRGIQVVVLDLRPPKEPFPANVLYYEADVASSEAVHNAAEQVRKDVGEPTVLINNAGIGIARPILQESEVEIRKTFNVNIIAHFITVKEFLPSMVKHNHGHIVSIASAASFITIAGNVDYSCSKVAALALHEGLRQELKHMYSAPNVRTSIFHPTWVRTPLIAPLLESGKFKDHVLSIDTVVDAVVDHVLKGESGQVVLPRRNTFILTALRALPAWLQEVVRDSRAGVLSGLPVNR